MADYTKLGFSQFLQSQSGPVSKEWESSYTIDSQFSPSLSGLNYSQLAVSNRPYRAVFSSDKNQGAYVDLQSSINYVNSIGGNILIKQGTYSITGTITMYSNISLFGEDNNTTVINFGSIPTNKVFGSVINNIGFDNLSFEHRYGTDGQGAITLGNSSDININNCFFQDNKTFGTYDVSTYDIRLVNCSRVIVNKCKSTNSFGFCELSGTTASVIHLVNNDIINNGVGFGLYSANGTAVFITNNNINVGTYAGVLVNSGAAAWFEGIDNCLFSNNFCYGSALNRIIYISSGGNSITNNILQTTTCSKGVELQGVSKTLIEGNKFLKLPEVLLLLNRLLFVVYC